MGLEEGILAGQKLFQPAKDKEVQEHRKKLMQAWGVAHNENGTMDTRLFNHLLGGLFSDTKGEYDPEAAANSFRELIKKQEEAKNLTSPTTIVAPVPVPIPGYAPATPAQSGVVPPPAMNQTPTPVGVLSPGVGRVRQ